MLAGLSGDCATDEAAPANGSGCQQLLALSLLERALQEAEHDLVRRPAWAAIPLAAIVRWLDYFPQNAHPERGTKPA